MDDVYPVVFLDALVLKIRDGGSVQRRAGYLALAIRMDGDRDVLGMWFQANEGAKFWMQILTDLKQRGVQDILIACVDGLKGFPEAIEAVFPQTTIQTCIVHLIRHSLKYVPRRQYDAVVKDLKPIYTAVDADQALLALETFEEKWGEPLPVIGRAWRDAWEHVIPFMAYEPEVRRVIYTTNAIEALNRQLRKALKTKGSFPSEDAARKLIYLASRTPSRNGPGREGGRKRCSRSRSNSETDCPTDTINTAYTQRRTPSRVRQTRAARTRKPCRPFRAPDQPCLRLPHGEAKSNNTAVLSARRREPFSVAPKDAARA